MADDTLDHPVEIQATRLDATLLPANFGFAYRMYVLNQGMDLGKVAVKANESGQAAYDAKNRNDQQDLILSEQSEKLNALQGDTVSLSKTQRQSLASPLDVSSSYFVNGVKVIGPRQTGWMAASGPDSKGSFHAGTPFPVDDNYNKGQLEAIAHGLREARQRIKALEDALRSHGLIDG